MTRRVREPIQVYLTADEREELDRVADALGVSRSEVLRRGILALSRPQSDRVLRDLAEEGYVTSARVQSAGPPPSLPVTSLDELLAGLDEDRSDR